MDAHSCLRLGPVGSGELSIGPLTELMICETSKTRQQVSHIVYARNIFYYRRMARPKTYPIKKVIGFDSEMLERIRNFRFDQRIDTESDAIRQLIETGLKAGPSAPSGGSTS